MKQLSAIFLVLAMVLALTACGKDDDRNNGGSPGRPDTNQSQNAPQDNGSGGSWQNGTDTPTQPAPEKTGEWGGYAARHAGGGTYGSRRGAHRHLPPDAGKRLCPRQRRLPRRRRKHQLVTFFAKTAAVSGKKMQMGAGKTDFSPCAHLAFLKKWAMIWGKEYVPPRAAEKRRVYYDKN